MNELLYGCDHRRYEIYAAANKHINRYHVRNDTAVNRHINSHRGRNKKVLNKHINRHERNDTPV